MVNVRHFCTIFVSTIKHRPLIDAVYKLSITLVQTRA